MVLSGFEIACRCRQNMSHPSSRPPPSEISLDKVAVRFEGYGFFGSLLSELGDAEESASLDDHAVACRSPFWAGE